MNSQDITRALIDTTVARAMVEMDADPKKSQKIKPRKQKHQKKRSLP